MLATGMISISAAATGFLGDPISEAVHHAASHVPVVGHLLERALPAHTRHGLFRREEHRAHGPRHVEVARATPGGSKSDGPYTTLP